MAECVDPNIPAVDNTALDCTEIISTDCIVTAEADNYMRYGKNINFTSVLGIFSRAIQKINTRLDNYLRTYKSYVAGISQAGTDVPVAANVVENNLNLTPIFSRAASGDYLITVTGAFTNKTVIIAPNTQGTFAVGTGVESTMSEFFVERVDVNTIRLRSASRVAGISTLADNLLDGDNTVLEIRVYD